ncbi:MAG: HAD-IA family hydrolase [Fimbriimonadaceae bacterium]|nr:MAG: HAD-IA family hydrolase [Fimbriimonadaceae bacterium]
MSIRAVSFDAAGTLIDVKWNPVAIAVEAAVKTGLTPSDPQVAEETYGRMLQSRWGHFQQLNLQRSREVCDEFWIELGRDWLKAIGHEDHPIEELAKCADNIIFGEGSSVFQLFDDSLAVLDGLKQRGIPMIILSNWDVSLHRTCEMLRITQYFHTIIASLEEGVEKPEKKLFDIAANQLGLPASEILHIGDDPLADVHGARNAGFTATLIDRCSPSDPPTQIQSLAEVLDLI